MSTARALGAAVLAVLFCPLASAQTRFVFDNLAFTFGSPAGPLTFSEPQFTDGAIVDGLAVTIVVSTPLRLTFGFTLYGVPSTDSTIYDTTGFPFSFVPPAPTPAEAIEGTAAGILSIDFGATVTSVDFDFALDAPAGGSVADACTITAFDAAGNQVGKASANADPAAPFFFFPEGHGAFAAAGGFRRIEVDFATELPEEIPALGGWGLAALMTVVGLAGARLLRRA